MDGERRRRYRSFLLGGLVGSAAGVAVSAAAGVAAAGRMKVRKAPPKRLTPAGLAAFEQAPCYRELVERESGERPSG